ncbi:hypothetical protein Tco_1531066 [Tanacetum coccineum]
MADENPISTLGDYSKPSHEGYKNTIELPVGNNVVPLRSDTIRLVQNGCSFHGLRSEDPNQHLKDFLKLVYSLDVDGENRERTHMQGLVSNFMASQDARLTKFEADFKQRQSEMTNKIDTVLKAITDQIAGALPSDTADPSVAFITEKGLKFNSFFESLRPRLSQVVLGKPFVKISNMTHDPPEGVVRFTNETDEVAYKMLHMIEQYNSLSDLEKEHIKSVYLRNEEDKRRGVEYVMSKILGFYKECLELGPEYVTGMDDEGEVTLYLMRRSLEVLRKFHCMIIGGRFNQLSHVSSPLLRKPGEY